MRDNIIAFIVVLLAFAGFCAFALYAGKSTRALNNARKAEDYQTKADLFRQKDSTFYRVADSLEVLGQFYDYKAAEAAKDLPKWLRE